MKLILKASLLSALFILTSCAHHGCCGKQEGHSEEQCEMHKKCKKEQCPMKADEKSAEKAPATK